MKGMRKVTFIILAMWVVACSAVETAAPTAVFVTDDTGTAVAAQSGQQWVLLSGVDEHGLLADAEVMLLKTPEVDGIFEAWVATGSPVAVLEIRHTGPQGLRRFYHVQTIDGDVGWISDYYVRPQAYLFDDHAQSVTLYDQPQGAVLATLSNVAPVLLQGPPSDGWWPVATPEGQSGWVPAWQVRESPLPEFLLNQPHDHE